MTATSRLGRLQKEQAISGIGAGEGRRSSEVQGGKYTAATRRVGPAGSLFAQPADEKAQARGSAKKKPPTKTGRGLLFTNNLL